MAGALTISTLNDSSGVLATQNGMTGIAKAWVNYNATTQTITNSFNISSVTYNATGDFTANFTTSMPNSNYVTVGMCGDLTYGSATYIEGTTYSTTAVRFLTRSGYTATPATGNAAITNLVVFSS
jgi:hypothetical protein